MSYAGESHKILRTVRVNLMSKPGYLGKVAGAIGKAGGDIGDVTIANIGPHSVTRDISVQVDREEQLAEIRAALGQLEGVEVVDIFDRIFEMHRGGKIHMTSRVKVDSLAELRKIYTPGVADVCRAIAKDRNKADFFTGIPNSVAIVTDGTAILGLGDIGPVAGMPVMEGKAALFDLLVGISGVPVLLATTDPGEIIRTVRNIAPGFGGILLEDIAAPACFEIEAALQRELDIPVMHDDQHGTAVVTLAAVLSACRQVGMNIRDAVVGQIGLGASGLANAKMLLDYGAREVLGTDLQQPAMDRLVEYGGRATNMNELMKKADIVVSTTGVAGLIKPEMIRKDQIILALSNPTPEIEPELALEAGAAYAADGRAVNNVLGFPGIFRGALDAGAKKITSAMLVRAAETLAGFAKDGSLVPGPLDREVHRAVAGAVQKVAMGE